VEDIPEEHTVRYRFASRKLRELYLKERGAHRYPEAIVHAFFRAMSVIDAAADERDIRALKSLRYERLRGSRKGDLSVRLNDQYRLTLKKESDEGGTYLLILGIEDYH
jgi:proteic killer suppression protein